MNPDQIDRIGMTVGLGTIALVTLLTGILCLMSDKRRVQSSATLLLLMSLLCCMGIVYILQP